MLRLAILIGIVTGLFTASHAWAESSGPNASGYFWFDSFDPGPTVPYAWVDATGGTLASISADDDSYVTTALPFTFSYFGTNYTQVDIGSNGLLSFDIGSACNDNYNWGPDDTTGQPIPQDDADCETHGWGGNPFIAPWFDDLDPGECGSVYYQTMGSMPNRRFVVEYDDVCHNDCSLCAAGEGVTFEVILYEGSNDIKVQYMDAFFSVATADISEENYGGTATVGLDKDATTGLQYSHATQAVLNNFAVLYQAPSDVGDVNCDTVDSVDALLVLQYTVGLLSEFNCPANAYVNGDGNIDSVDALLILQYVAGLLNQLPPP